MEMAVTILCAAVVVAVFGREAVRYLREEDE